MAQPVTTTELLLREVADRLIEIRDLLREPPASPEPDQPQLIQEPVVVSPAPSRPRSRATKKT